MLDATLSDLTVHHPTAEAMRSESAALREALGSASPDGAASALAAWDQRRRTWETWKNLAAIRFAQDTRDASRKADKERWDMLSPVLQEQDVELARVALQAPGRDALLQRFGPHLGALWRSAAQAFEPALADLRREESRLSNSYDELRAGLTIPFRGRDLTLSSIRGFFGDADRTTRCEAIQAEDAAMGRNREALDGLYGELVAVRARMAGVMGLPSFVPLGYRWMKRTDWGPAEAASFRAGVLAHIVPLAAAIRRRRAAALGTAGPTYHDEAVRDLRGVPRPLGGPDDLVAAGAIVMERLGPGPRRFFDGMQRRGMLDLLCRPGKVGGGFAEALPDAGTPFILTNFNGSQDDAIVLIHELGHGYQMYASLAQPLLDFLIPTFEAAEVHSMGAELLAFPHMELVFGDDAERFRQGHLEQALLFLPYSCAVDEFQHHVYEEPSLTAPQRATLWKDMEARWLPWRRYEGMPHYESGRFWQRQLHIYQAPFYYLDYSLAQVCALQLWSRGRKDAADAVATWEQLCALGGSRSFSAALREVGLGLPFDEPVLAGVAGEVRSTIGL
jgi:M3 family oligoendopeptidase